jgi:CheY-like chemotaxis protein
LPTVLLVEDDPAVRKMIEVLMRSAGYEVITAARGDEALRMVAGDSSEAPHPVDALVTDVIMPGNLDGAELARRLREHLPALGVVCTSGFVRDVLTDTSDLPAGAVFLQKPFSAEDLLDALSRVIPGT